jgi:probable phosphoglycerate mutase
MRLYFVRHCESEANVQEIFWNEPVGYGLTERGRAQAQDLADGFAGVEFAALYCSPVLRAVQTAQIVGPQLGLAPVIADELRECGSGILKGRKIDAETRSMVVQVREQWIVHGNPDARIEGAESYAEIAARFTALIDRLQGLYRDTAANLLLISHGGMLGIMLPMLLSNVEYDVAVGRPFDYMMSVVAELRDEAWVCLRWADLAFSEA